MAVLVLSPSFSSSGTLDTTETDRLLPGSGVPLPPYMTDSFWKLSRTARDRSTSSDGVSLGARSRFITRVTGRLSVCRSSKRSLGQEVGEMVGH